MAKPAKPERPSIDLDFFENILLFKSLTDSEYLSSIVEYLDPSLFNDKHVACIVRHVSSFFKERGTVPSLTEIKTRMTSGEDQEALAQIKSKISTIDPKLDPDELRANTEHFLKERFVYKTILEVAEKISDKSFSLDTALADFEKAYNISLKDNLGMWYFDDVDKHIEDLTAVHKPIPTGWAFLDNRTEGGLFAKTLNIFAGQVNVGKSIVLGNIAANLVMRGYNVLLVSLEMSEYMYAKRISAQLTQIPHNDLKSYPDELKEQLEHIKNQIDSKLVIKEYPPKTVTVRHIDAFVTKLKHKGFKPDVIVIDYMNLIAPTKSGMNLYESVKEVAEQLRAMAFKYDVPVVSATQISRQFFNTVSPGMEGISESIGVAATSDLMCSIWQSDEDRELGVINMGIQKNRFGPNFGQAAFKCNYNTLTLKETNRDYFESDEGGEDSVEKADNALTLLSEDKPTNK